MGCERHHYTTIEEAVERIEDLVEENRRLRRAINKGTRYALFQARYKHRDEEGRVQILPMPQNDDYVAIEEDWTQNYRLGNGDEITISVGSVDLEVPEGIEEDST